MAHVTENMRAATRGRPLANKQRARIERLKRAARKAGERGAIQAVHFMVAAMQGLVPGIQGMDRAKVAQDLMERFGYPKLAQIQHFGDFPTKLYELAVPEPAAATPPPPPAGNGGNGHAAPEPNGGEVTH